MFARESYVKEKSKKKKERKTAILVKHNELVITK